MLDQLVKLGECPLFFGEGMILLSAEVRYPIESELRHDIIQSVDVLLGIYISERYRGDIVDRDYLGSQGS